MHPVIVWCGEIVAYQCYLQSLGRGMLSLTRILQSLDEI